MSDGLLFNDGMNDRWPEAVSEHKAHAAAEWPKEAVGFILQDGSYRTATNIASDPVLDFAVPDEEYRAADGGRPAALLHSHTAQPDPVTGKSNEPLPCPSAADMASQIAMGIPWGISLCIESGASDPFWFGDQVPRAPLLHRVFRHGVHDCYAFIRDWYAEETGIRIPEFPRDVDWWEKPPEGEVQQDLYLQGFEQAGFVRADRPYAPLPGDVFLCKVKSPVLNHGGVYIGGGLIAHHLLWQLSMRTSAALWRPKLDFLVRHRDLPEDWRAD